MEITFNPEANQIFFDFLGNALLKTDGLFAFSTGIKLESVELGLLRSFTINESFELNFQGGWELDDLSFTQDGSTFSANLDELDFAISVAPEFTAGDFQNLDFNFNGTSVVEIASVDEPSTFLSYCLTLGLGILSRRKGIRRQKKRELEASKL